MISAMHPKLKILQNVTKLTSFPNNQVCVLGNHSKQHILGLRSVEELSNKEFKGFEDNSQ